MKSFAQNPLSKFVVACGLLALLSPAHAASDALELYSPKDTDHFEVTTPVLFWHTSPQAKRYEIFIDGAKAGEIPAAAVPVVSFVPASPLAVGEHHWFVKAFPASGAAETSGTFSFTVDPDKWPAWAIGPFVRYGKNPLLAPQGADWESRNVYNPGVLFDNGRFRMLYRAQGKPVTSREGYAESVDGVTFVRNPTPLIDATEPFEMKYGCEDARFLKYEGTYYAFYTGNKPGGGIALCEATSPNGKDWKKLGPVIQGTKNAAIVSDPNGTPIKIDGKFVMYCGNSNFGISYSDDLLTWTPMAKIDMKLPDGWVAPFEPCVAVANHSAARPDDIVLFIAGTLNGKGKWFYAISEVLFSKKNLTTKVEQLDDCIMKASEPYESGQYRNCLWMNCIIQHNDQWLMYYGAGDRNVGLATAPMK